MGHPHHPFIDIGAIPDPSRPYELVLPLRQLLPAYGAGAERTTQTVRATRVGARSNGRTRRRSRSLAISSGSAASAWSHCFLA